VNFDHSIELVDRVADAIEGDLRRAGLAQSLQEDVESSRAGDHGDRLKGVLCGENPGYLPSEVLVEFVAPGDLLRAGGVGADDAVELKKGAPERLDGAAAVLLKLDCVRRSRGHGLLLKSGSRAGKRLWACRKGDLPSTSYEKAGVMTKFF
jgi:hypothetical protein